MQLKECGDIRVYILTILQFVGIPLEYSEINDIILQDGFVTNFDFIEQFAYLAENGLVKIKDGKYSITKQGDFVADTLKSDIYGYIRERGMRNSLRYLSFKEKKIKVKYSEEKCPDGTYNLNCRLVQAGKDVLNVTVNADTQFQTSRMAQNFVDKPEHLYKLVYSFLVGETEYPGY